MSHPTDSYKFHRDLWFKKETPLQVCDALASAFARQFRVRIWCGDAATGTAWLEEYDVVGTIGRSTGQRKVPLLINRTNSVGGPAVLDHCIVRIDRTDGAGTVYKHPSFTHGFESYSIALEPGTTDRWNVTTPEGVVASFNKKLTAERWVAFMRGERYNK